MQGEKLVTADGPTVEDLLVNEDVDNLSEIEWPSEHMQVTYSNDKFEKLLDLIYIN